MRLSLSILGTEVWSLHLCVGCACAGEETEEVADVISGGYSHDFERDTTPLDPTDHYGEWEDKTRFGFGGRS